MSSKPGDYGTQPRRKDPYKESDARPSALSIIIRLGLLFIIVVACGLASLLLYERWQTSQGGSEVLIEGGNPNLGVSERLFLQSYLATHANALEQPANSLGQSASFVISPGESANQIAGNLLAANLLVDEELFINYLRFYGLDSRLTAGTVRVDPGLTVPELAVLLTNPYQRIELNFLEGWRLEEMANYLAVTTPAQINAEEFLALVQRRQGFDLTPYRFLVGHPAGASLEGYLFPTNYEIPTDANAVDLLDMMLVRFEEQVTPTMRQAYGAHGLTLREAVTLASIVERETPLDSEKPRIAGVFLNRLAQGMPLQADSTVQYALGRDSQTGGWWKSPLFQSDLEIDSRYNTYQVPDLPPGPIANPGLQSLLAVAEPEQSNFLFFVLDCATQTGHLFSVTYEEHLSNVQRCLAP